MFGNMMHRPLLISDIITYAAEIYPNVEIITRNKQGYSIYKYYEVYKRISKLAHALQNLGINSGDRIATLAWNTHKHFELYYAISGLGAICHTINPRLPPSEIEHILAHAQDRILFYDMDLQPLVERVLAGFDNPPAHVALCDEDEAADAGLPFGTLLYEGLLAEHNESFAWPELDERTAAGLCYTSGTTGKPKGVLYSHRSTILHAMMTVVGRVSPFSPGGRILPAVPMFHVNAWGLPYSAPLMGQTLIMPGPKLDGDSLFALMDEQKVTTSWGVPTVWQGLLDAMKRRGRKPVALEEIVVGGAPAPGALIERFEDRFGVTIRHAWGMTEMSPVGTSGMLNPEAEHSSRAERTAMQLRQGRRLFGVEMAIIDETDNRLPHDGQASGQLIVRGNNVVAEYFSEPEATAKSFTDDGWFRTGDIAQLSPDGWMTIVDRAKDIIKSGGEWISSVKLEEAAMRFPPIKACAAIGIPDRKWGERPVLFIKVDPEFDIDLEALRQHLAKSFPRWQLPDQIHIRTDLPMTATGKISKKDLRNTL